MLSLIRLIVSWATLFAVGTDLFVVSPLIPLISSDYQVSVQMAGLIVTAFATGYLVAAPLLGHLADRTGRRRVLTWSLAAFAAANLSTAAAQTLPAMIAARLLCGIAAAGITPSIYALIGSAAPAGHRGTWVAIVLTGLLSSLPLGASIGVWASISVGWAVVFSSIGGCSLVFALAHRAVWADDRIGSAAGSALPDGFSALQLLWTIMPTVAWSSALYGMYTYLGAGLTALGYQPGAIAEIVLIYGAGAFAGALLGGRMADRLGSLVTVRMSLATMFVGFMALWLAIHNDTFVDAAFAIISLAAQMFFPAQQLLLLGKFPTRYATALSCNNSALFAGIALGSVIGGQALAAGGFTAILPVSAAVALVAYAGLGWQWTRSGNAGAIRLSS